jgi:Glycosyl transferase family 2
LAYDGLIVVVPSRNRPDTAAAAVRSVLGRAGSGVEVLVSDNSTDPGARARLEAFCAGLAREPVRYVRPPEPLPMPPHWSWALEQALEGSGASHVTYLTDRMVFKPDALAAVLSVVGEHPDRVVSYSHDTVDDRRLPAALHPYPWTGRLFEVDATHLLYLSSRGVIRPPLPRMMNCVVPREVLGQVRERFGGVFESISPDFCFTYRCLDLVDSIVYYDRTALIQHAMQRSQGASYSRGEDTRDRVDFATQLGETAMNNAAPVPDFHTIRNAIFHEYCFVKAESRSGRFPEVDPRAYMGAILEDFSQLENPDLRDEQLAVLRDTGWVGAPRRRYEAGVSAFGALLRGWSVARGATDAVLGLVRRLLRPGMAGALRRIGLPVPTSLIGFASGEQAIEYAQAHPAPPAPDTGHIEQLFEPPGATRELPQPR